MWISRLSGWCAAGLLAMALTGAARAASLGDVNGDGQVTVADAVQMLRIVVGVDLATGIQLAAGDVSPRPGTEGRPVGDGRLNVQDVTRILQFAVGLVSPQDFGIGDAYIALSPSHANLGPLDQVQFNAVPINFDGAITWAVTGDSSVLGDLSTDGIYTAPKQIQGAMTVTIHAGSGAREATATVDLSRYGPPPPPPLAANQ